MKEYARETKIVNAILSNTKENLRPKVNSIRKSELAGNGDLGYHPTYTGPNSGTLALMSEKSCAEPEEIKSKTLDIKHFALIRL